MDNVQRLGYFGGLGFRVEEITLTITNTITMSITTTIITASTTININMNMFEGGGVVIEGTGFLFKVSGFRL